MIHSLIVRTLNKFKQRPNKELYTKCITEEYNEFIEAKTEEEKIKEAVDLLWVTVGYLWSVFRGNENKVLKAYKSVYESNMSKVCYSEEEAKNTIKKYKNKGVDTYSIRYNDDDGDYWVIYDYNKKYKKGINYVPADMSWVKKSI